MADPGKASHQHFDIIRCKLCDNIYSDPRLLSCLHSFCNTCLENYIKDPEVQSNEGIVCPLCQETTGFTSGDDVDGLLKNLVLDRLITQVQREQTKVVAEQEVLKIQAEALTEEELASEDIQKTILHIAKTAGKVIAHKTEDQSRVHDFETIKPRQELQKKITNLQEKALDIVYAIDEVNQEMQGWESQKDHLKEAIKQRSQEIQNIIQATERKLLAKVEDRNDEKAIKDLGFETKSNLHKTLKGTLNVVDFLKLLTEYGDKENLKGYQEIADERIDKFMKENIEYQRMDLTFESPKADLSEAIELMFGTLSERSEMKVIWNPQESKRAKEINLSPIDSSPTSDVESHNSIAKKDGIREEAYLTPRYAEINESHNEMVKPETAAAPSQALKHRRRPLKSSMSFDEGTSRILYQTHLPTYHSHFIKRQAEAQMQNEDDQTTTEVHSDDSDDSRSTGNQSQTEERGHASVSSHPGYYGRRSSAPPSMIIDALAKRRLSALAILERSNISIKGLGIPTDAEMGFNQARLEWMRENLKRKNEGMKRSFEQENF